MNYKIKGIILIIVGVIIGLVISIGINNTSFLSADNKYFVEEKYDEKAEYKKFSLPFIQAAEKTKPATVFIFTEKVITVKENPFFSDPFRDFFGDEFFKRFFGDRFGDENKNQERKYKQTALGSGVIVSPDGYILTNNHVIKDADEIKVKLSNNSEYKAKVIGTDPRTEIAVIKIEGKNLPYAKLGDSSKLEIGEWVIAIGNPFGLSYTVTAGIISATGRSNIGVADYEDFIQTDAPINRGNSGGPMINLNGDVVGINTAIFSQTGGNLGIGFAVPINMAKKIMIDLIEKGKVVRGYLGVMIQDIDKTIAKQFKLPDVNGVLISQVTPNSPADKAGLKRGDVIIEFDGVKITNTSQLRNLVANSKINTNVNIKIIRDGKEKSLSIYIVEQPKDFDKSSFAYSEESGEVTSNKLGITVKELSPELAKKFNYSTSEKGVIITEIENGSKADIGGLKEGDIILEINRKNIKTVEDFNEALKDIDDNNEKEVLFLIKRQKVTIYLVLNLD
ncbi:MAG TPA: DegQ family serine endoprotease [bacterium]|nr:DegQ family serine endoprotease [bacterium]HOL47102.1 DegQ family serine endoprotease [bacterium]HPQ18856.1 DegQ family serine endoprotease [bacterium]